MKKFIFTLATFVAISLNAIGQSGWTMVDSGLPVGIGVGQISVGMNDNTALWGLAINNDGSIYDAFTRSTDGGNTWETGTFNAGNGLSQLFAFDADVCWAVFNTGADQGLYKTVDGGVNWEKKGDAYGSGSFANVIHFFDDMNGFAQGDPLGGYYELYVTTDGGENWTRIDEPNIPAPTSGEYGITGNYCAVGDNIWWGTNQGRIFRSNDKGYTWDVSMTVFGAAQVVSSIMFDESNGFAFRSYLNLGIESVLNETNDGGETWTEFNTVGDSYARYFYHIPSTVNTVIGSAMDPTAGMGISISEDGGHNWTQITGGYAFQASAWLDLETGWCGTFTTAKSSGGMYIYGEVEPPPAPTNLEAVVEGSTVHLTWTAPAQSGFSDDFESYDDFVLEFAPWTNIDVDGSTTYGMTGTTWPNAFDPQAFIIFNPSTTEPPITDIIPHSGDKLAACFASTTPDNDDWMITPMISIESGASVNFWAKSYTDQYGLERFRVGVSTTGINPSDFTIISPGDYVEAPADDWEEYNYSLDSYAGQSVYVAIQCVSSDAFILLVDDFDVGVAKSDFIYNQTKPMNGSATRSLLPVNYQPLPTVIKEVKGTNDFLGYNVYRDGVVINTSLVPTESYDDEGLAIGQYEYYVTAMYDEGESDPSNTVIVDVITAINEVSGNTIQIYPNPVTDYINVKSDSKIISVELMNLMGQRIIMQKVNKLTHQINLTDLQSGIYIVKVELENGTVTRRIAVN